MEIEGGCVEGALCENIGELKRTLTSTPSSPPRRSRNAAKPTRSLSKQVGQQRDSGGDQTQGPICGESRRDGSINTSQSAVSAKVWASFCSHRTPNADSYTMQTTNRIVRTDEAAAHHASQTGRARPRSTIHTCSTNTATTKSTRNTETTTRIESICANTKGSLYATAAVFW